MGKYCKNLRTSKSFLNKLQKTHITNKNVDRFDFLQIKNFDLSKLHQYSKTKQQNGKRNSQQLKQTLFLKIGRFFSNL